MTFTLLDVIFAAIVLLSGLLGWARGLLREAIGIFCFVISLAGAYAYALNAGPAAWGIVGFRNVVGYVFLAAVLVTFILAAWVSHFGMAPRITVSSRIAGLMFGLARGVLVFAIAVVLINVFVSVKEWPGWFTAAQSRELAVDYMRLYWPKEWTGMRIVQYPYVIMGLMALYLSIVTDLIAAITRPLRLRLRRDH